MVSPYSCSWKDRDVIDANFLVWGAWLGAFLVLEGLAIARHTPWTTLSE